MDCSSSRGHRLARTSRCSCQGRRYRRSSPVSRLHVIRAFHSSRVFGDGRLPGLLGTARGSVCQEVKDCRAECRPQCVVDMCCYVFCHML